MPPMFKFAAVLVMNKYVQNKYRHKILNIKMGLSKDIFTYFGGKMNVLTSEKANVH